MCRLASLVFLVSLSCGALAQPLAESVGGPAPPPRVLSHTSLGVGPGGLGAVVMVGPNLGRLTPQAFGALWTWTGDDYPSLGLRAGTLNPEFRASAGVLGRLAVGSPSDRLDVAAVTGAALAVVRGEYVPPADRAPEAPFDPESAYDLDRAESLWRAGPVGVFGLELTGWLTERVGLSVSAHQTIGLPGPSWTESISVGVTTPQGETISGSVRGPRLEESFVGVGLRLGRQRR